MVLALECELLDSVSKVMLCLFPFHPFSSFRGYRQIIFHIHRAYTGTAKPAQLVEIRRVAAAVPAEALAATAAGRDFVQL